MASDTKQEGLAPEDESAEATTKPGRTTIANAALMIYIERGRHVGLTEEVKKRSAS